MGQRRREAESSCADLVVIDVDEGVEAAAFEIVARALEEITPRVEVECPGRCSFPTRGPARYFGGDAELARFVREVVSRALTAPGRGTSHGPNGPNGSDERCRDPDVRVGVADGRFAASHAARTALPHDGGVQVVDPGGSAAFLAPLPVTLLGDDDLAVLLIRLGLSTLGDFASLPAASVLARFGPNGRRLHVLAGGADPDLTELEHPPPDLVEQIELDPPVERVDEAAFVAKALGDRFLVRLSERGLGCTRVLIEAETEHGERLSRRWRHEGALTPRTLAERVRWQLDGWLREAGIFGTDARGGDPREAQNAAVHNESFPEAGTSGLGALTLLRLVPDGVVPSKGRQLGFWGGDQAAADRADRALARVQGMLGYEAVVSLVPQGGRTPAERIRWVPWGEPREPSRPIREVMGPVTAELPTWPGAVPGPAPARVFDPPLAAELLDEHEDPVRVNGRGELSGAPTRLLCTALEGGGGAVTHWAGPWIHDVRWWDLAARRRRVLWQVTVNVGSADAGSAAPTIACLVATERGRASIDAIYD